MMLADAPWYDDKDTKVTQPKTAQELADAIRKIANK
jgi:hypothetical protein